MIISGAAGEREGGAFSLVAPLAFSFRGPGHRAGVCGWVGGWVGVRMYVHI
jgi:hypothetical protein